MRRLSVGDGAVVTTVECNRNTDFDARSDPPDGGQQRAVGEDSAETAGGSKR